MQIKKKLFVEVIVLSIVLSVVTFLTVYNVILIENNFSILNNELIPILTNLKDMRLIATNMLSSTLEYAVLSENNKTSTDHLKLNQELDRIRYDINDEKIQFNQILSAYDSKTVTTNDEIISGEIRREWNELEQLSGKFLEYKKRGITDDAFIKLNGDFIKSKESLFTKIDSAIIMNQQNVDEKREFVSDVVADTAIIVFVNLIVFVLLVVVLRYYILRSMFSTISQLRKVTKEIASGNLKIKVNAIPKDEVGELLVDVEKMALDLDNLQKKLLESERFSVIGELAARMAHDIRNPLTSIKIGAEYFRKKPNWGDRELNMLNIMDDAIDRISFQIQDVLDYIKVTPLVPEKISLLDLLKQSTADQKLPDGIEIILPENDLILECDAKKMQVVFVNTIRNAIDAVKPSGKITVRLTDSEDHTKIEIEDTGPGISPENQSKVFDPLFTTKMRGTGLGLSSVKNIIEQHGGSITFSNNPTIFSIILPKQLNDSAHLG